MFKIEINTDNSAFDDKQTEIARILRSVADKIGNGGLYSGMPLIDYNGNVVGKAEEIADEL